MEDKEIIINGVDVHECDRLIVNQLYGYVCNCEEDKHLISSCKNRPNCHFKQLARKTKECEELKENLRMSELKNTILQNRNQQLDGSMTESDRYCKALEEIGKIVKINCEEICGRKFEDCNDFLCSSKNIIDIINKAKGEGDGLS